MLDLAGSEADRGGLPGFARLHSTGGAGRWLTTVNACREETRLIPRTNTDLDATLPPAATYWMHIADKNVLFLAGIFGIVVATVVRFFAYRFLVFNKELDEEPGYDHDHELIDSGKAGKN